MTEELQTVVWPLTIACSSRNFWLCQFIFFGSWLKHYNSSVNEAVTFINVEGTLLQRDFLFTAGEHGRDGLCLAQRWWEMQ